MQVGPRRLLSVWPALLCDFHKLISQTQNVNEQFRDGAKWFHYLNFFQPLVATAVVMVVLVVLLLLVSLSLLLFVGYHRLSGSSSRGVTYLTWTLYWDSFWGFVSFFLLLRPGSLGNESEIILIGLFATQPASSSSSSPTSFQLGAQINYFLSN